MSSSKFVSQRSTADLLANLLQASFLRDHKLAYPFNSPLTLLENTIWVSFVKFNRQIVKEMPIRSQFKRMNWSGTTAKVHCRESPVLNFHHSSHRIGRAQREIDSFNNQRNSVSAADSQFVPMTCSVIANATFPTLVIRDVVSTVLCDIFRIKTNM